VRRKVATAPPLAPRKARTRKAAAARAQPAPTRARARERATPRVRVAAPPPAPAIKGPLGHLLHGEAATQLESALARVRQARPASPTEKHFATVVVARMRPWLLGAARKEHQQRARRMGVELKELLHVSEVAVLDCCRRFTPGQAGPGRTLFPAYALRAARQAMGRLVQERRSVVPLTSWGQKLRRKAQRQVVAAQERGEALPMREALAAAGASPSSVAALERGRVATVSLFTSSELVGDDDSHSEARWARAEVESHAEAAEHRASLAERESAMEGLEALPAEQRQVVVQHLGMEGPATPLPTLARRMGVELATVERLYAAALATLRTTLEAE
jgi:DNA-directed RNA polymerase specialized sigma24 family protein